MLKYIKKKNILLRTKKSPDLKKPVKQDDRNLDKGGRSFYFFDFDDNILSLTTSVSLFHNKDNSEILISSRELAKHGQTIGKSGLYQNYHFDLCDKKGSFRAFRDLELSLVDKIFSKKRKQNFIKDIFEICQLPEFHWQGPAWNYFQYASYNKRPISIITARGHSPKTIKDGINILFKERHIHSKPNYLSIYPVSNLKVRKELGDHHLSMSVADLKKIAIIKSVETAIKKYGENPFHRFGMSEDDPKNIELVTEAMLHLKARYPQMSFFVINTHHGHCIKTEIFKDRLERKDMGDQADVTQPGLFDL